MKAMNPEVKKIYELIETDNLSSAIAHANLHDFDITFDEKGFYVIPNAVRFTNKLFNSANTNTSL